MTTFSAVEQDILHAAEQHFAGAGFHETVVSDIADDAGVGKGTVYRHFGNKSELFGTLIERGSDELKAALEKLLNHRMTVEEAVRSIVTVHFDFYEKKNHLMEVVVKEGLARTGDELEEVLEKFSNYRAVVSEILAEATTECSDLPEPDVLSQLLLSWIWGLFRDRIIFGLHAGTDVYVDTLVTTFVEGLKNHE